MRPLVMAIALLLLLVGVAASEAAHPNDPFLSMADQAYGSMRPYLQCVRGEAIEGTPAKILISNKDGRSCIFYDPLKFKGINDKFGDSAIFGVFAHELGHIVGWRNGDLSQATADMFAGCALARAKRPSGPYIRLLMAWGESDERIKAVIGGYGACK